MLPILLALAFIAILVIIVIAGQPDEFTVTRAANKTARRMIFRRRLADVDFGVNIFIQARYSTIERGRESKKRAGRIDKMNSHLSVTDFRLASPFSNWQPHILSKSMNRPNTLLMKQLLPAMLHVTTL